MVIAAFCRHIPKIGNEAIGTKTQGKPVHDKYVPNDLGLLSEDCVQGLVAQSLSFPKGFDFKRINGAEEPKVNSKSAWYYPFAYPDCAMENLCFHYLNILPKLRVRPGETSKSGDDKRVAFAHKPLPFQINNAWQTRSIFLEKKFFQMR